MAFIYGFPLGTGGVESHLLSLIARGSRSEFEWIFVGQAEEGFAGKAAQLGARVVDWRPLRWHGDLKAMVHLGRVLKGERVDLVHVHSPRAILQIALVARLLGVPVIETVHLPLRYLVGGRGRLVRLKVWAYELSEKVAVRHLANRTLFVSARACEESIQNGLVLPERALVVPNGVELERFAGGAEREQVRRALGVPLEATVACFVGRLEDQKGIDVLIDALASLDLGRLGLRCWLVGDGPRREELKARARAKDLEGQLTFLSFRADVERFLSAADFFVLPSRFEAMPIALLEAMAAGLACVTTDVGDNSLLVKNGVQGLIVPPGDPRALASAVETLAQDRHRRKGMGLAAKEASKAYSAEGTAQRVEGVYRSVLGDRRNRTTVPRDNGLA